MTDDLSFEKQLRLEKLRRALPELSRQELEEVLMETTIALVKLTDKVQQFCKDHGIV